MIVGAVDANPNEGTGFGRVVEDAEHHTDIPARIHDERVVDKDLEGTVGLDQPIDLNPPGVSFEPNRASPNIRNLGYQRALTIVEHQRSDIV